MTKLTEITEHRKNTYLEIAVDDCNILWKYSSYSKLRRIIALCLRFRPTNTYREELCIKELNEAKIRIIKITQASRFSQEKSLATKQPINKRNIAALNSFIDENGLIRISGHFRRSKLAFTQKYPILLPNRHFNTIIGLIIREIYE